MSIEQSEFRYLQGAFKDLEGPIGGNVSSLLWCPVTRGRLWCGTVAGELYFKDINSAWQRCEPPFRPMMKVESIEVVTGSKPALLALSNTGNLAISTDDGQSWMHNLPGLNEESLRVIQRHPLHSGYVLAGARNGLFYSPDNGRTWGCFSTKQSFTFITAIEFSSVDPLLFFVADSDGFSARVLMTENGGFTFTTILEGETLFNQIHSLILHDSTLWVGGSGFGWRAARATIGKTVSWRRLSSSLPVTAITCMEKTHDGRIIIGSNGSGLYCFSEEKESWKRIDIEPKRRYVSCLSASSAGLAAGFLDYGLAMESSGDWIEINEKLYARNISRLQQFGEELLAVADEQLFIRTADRNWSVLPGFQLVQDVLAHGSRCFTTGLYSGVFQRDLDPRSQWKDLKLPAGRAMLVRTSSKGDLFVMTLVKRDRFRFFQFDSNGPCNQAPWKECCPDLPISGFVNDFAVDLSEDLCFITVSSSQGVFCYDSYTNRWLPSQLPEATRVSGLYRSRHNPDVLYAATGRILLKSLDFGRSFEEVIGNFPSKISSLTVSGLSFESIWISTENGGIYVSHYPNYWNALHQDEVLLPINQIAVDTINQGIMYCGTQGVSCRQLAIPSINAHLQKEAAPQQASLRVYGKNPGPALEVDLHYLLIKPGTKTFSHLKIDGDLLKRSSKPWPIRLTLEALADNIELSTSDVSKSLLRKDNKIAVALCFPEKFHPVCDIQLAQIR